MTEKEKYIVTRSAAKIVEYDACRSYRNELMIQWCINNEACKALNRKSNELYQAKKTADNPTESEKLEQGMKDIYVEKLQLQADMLNAEISIRIPPEVTSGKTSAASKKNAIEKYIQLQLFVILTENAPLDDPEISAMIQWCSTSQKISEIKQQIQKQYAIYHHCINNNKPIPDVHELNTLRKKEDYYKKELDEAEKILGEVAEKDNFASPFRQTSPNPNRSRHKKH